MKLYPRLAWDSIRKNKKLYLPYWLTCSLCVCMFCILHYLSISPTLQHLRGGSSLGVTMGLGVYVMGFFSAIFLFYTQSFLIRKRKKEFGLYNVFGMNKQAIGKILFWEMVFTILFALLTGLVFGMVFSRISELTLAKLIHAEIQMGIHINVQTICITLIVFLGIFVLILLNSICQVRFSTASELMKSDAAGEKAPKANWVLAVLGLLLLGVSYYLCLVIKSPLTALLTFFVAVIMVIIGTYLVMISGSVALCSVLKKNKRYYYQENHFISIGFMTWRMKRNGAGLATICILATMVLVMLSSTSCLYFGAEDSLRTRYPRELFLEDECDYTEEALNGVSLLKKTLENSIAETGMDAHHPLSCVTACFYGLLKGNTILLDPALADDFYFTTASNLVQVVVLSSDDYSYSTGQSLQLNDGEILMYSNAPNAPRDAIVLEDTAYHVTGHLSDFQLGGSVSVDVIPCIVLIVSDVSKTVESYIGKRLQNGESYLDLKWVAGFDSDSDAETQKLFLNSVRDSFSKEKERGAIPKNMVFHWSQREAERKDFYQTFGGFFFLGILLSIVFLAAAALIIYYKQICEGYEDQHRFGILMKLGVSRRTIWKSIRSQMLTVFYFPLVLAAIHLGFAFLMIRRLLFLFNINNLPLLIATVAISVIGFALFYVVIYRVTAKNYYSIVCSEE